MNEEQQKWVAHVEALIATAKETNSSASYETLCDSIQLAIDTCPEP